MTDSTTLPGMVRAHDARIRSCLEGRSQAHFWHACCPMSGPTEARLQRFQALGFDNYPLAQIPAVDALRTYLFFFERILGAKVVSPAGHDGDFFQTWCQPWISSAAQVSGLRVDLGASPLWQAYEKAISDYLAHTPADQRLPVAFMGLSPFDIACNVCGPEPFCLMLHDEPEAAAGLLDFIVTLLVDAHRRIRGLGTRLVSPYGFPGVYISDLQLPLLSPAHVGGLVLPCYERIAKECGGLTFALLSADLDVLRAALRMDGLVGCSFDKRLPLPEIRKHLGRKIFVIFSYCYDDALEAPTLRDGIWWNPIVQSYSRELPQVYREMAAGHNLLIGIDRPSLAEVLALRSGLQGTIQ